MEGVNSSCREGVKSGCRLTRAGDDLNYEETIVSYYFYWLPVTESNSR